MTNSYELGHITYVWKKLYPYESVKLYNSKGEHFYLYELCQTMILGLVEDERLFKALQFVKIKVCNRLKKNLENCLRIYISSYKVENFPRYKVLTKWIYIKNRQSVTNIERNANDFSDSDHDPRIQCSWIQIYNGVGIGSNNLFQLPKSIWYFKKFIIISFHNSSLFFEWC